jgi:hypothetical protein
MVGRFQVMALLQAARAKALGYPLDEAESFGLKRAIFYAAAKRGFNRATLESRRKFYEEVYKPRRDELAKAWSALSKQARS